MTYKQIVDKIKQAVYDHYQLADFGYGQISDIKNGADDTEADYPYAFLNPGTHTRGERSVIYRFNLIIMDLYVGDNFLDAQSNCQQYIDDILAELKYNNTEVFDTNINATLTPFKERFQDVVGGMTATIEVEVPLKLNLCIAPFNSIIPPPPVGELVLDVESTTDYTFSPDDGGEVQRYQQTNLDTYNAMRPNLANLYYINGYTPSAGRWIFTETGTAVKLVGSVPYVNPRVLIVAGDGGEVQINPTTSTFPSNSTIGVDFDYVCTWEVDLDPAIVDYVAVGDHNEPVSEPEYQTYAGTRLTAVFQPQDIPQPVPPVVALTHGQPTSRQLAVTNAAFGSSEQSYDSQYFEDGSYSMFSCTSTEDLECTLNFTGNFQYSQVYPWTPADWQLAIVNSYTGEFIGMTDIPATSGAVNITSNQFTFPAGYGSYYFTLFERGTANPNTNPSFVNQPLDFDGTIQINVQP